MIYSSHATSPLGRLSVNLVLVHPKAVVRSCAGFSCKESIQKWKVFYKRAKLHIRTERKSPRVLLQNQPESVFIPEVEELDTLGVSVLNSSCSADEWAARQADHAH